jgi:hypothetical protein
MSPQAPDLANADQLDMHGEATINQAICDYFGIVVEAAQPTSTT